MERFFGIDLRGLAVLRLILGVTLLYDLAVRATSLEMFLTDGGVLPVSQARANIPLAWVPSVHLLSGAWGWQAFLLALHVVVVLAFLVGRHVRVAAALCWYLTTSLHFRNEMVLNGGDYVLRWTLFWCMFLPLGSRYSWSEYRGRKEGRPPPSGVVANVATAGLLLQVCVLYWGSAMNKEIDLWLLHPRALYYALNLDPFTSSVGVHIKDAVGPLALLTVLVYCLEWLAPVLLLTGVPALRTTGISLLVGFHLSVAVLMQVGLFWLTPLPALIAFLPRSVWDRFLPEQKSEPFAYHLPLPLEVVLGLVMVFIPYLNLSLVKPGLPVPSPLYALFRTMGFHYGWNMFSRVNQNLDGWYVIEASLKDGRTVNLLTGKEIDFAKPPVSEIYPNQRWRRYMADLYRPGGEPYLRSLATFLAREWELRGGASVQRIRLHYLVEKTPEEPGPVRPEDRVLLDFLYRSERQGAAGACAFHCQLS